MKELIEKLTELIEYYNPMDTEDYNFYLTDEEAKQIIEALEFYEKCKRVQPFDQLTK